VTLDGTIDVVVRDISDDTTTDAERGLLGVTFSSDGSLLYVSFTDEDGNSRIDEYGVVEDGTVDTESRRSVFDQDQPFANHNGGHVATGPDGFLYIGLGDGGAAGDPERSSLDPSTVLGKLLRIDPSRPSTDLPYSVPEDNPFVGVDGARAEIWSLGLRNPWRFSFDRTTGDLWIGDVGQNVWEEIDRSTVAEGAGRGVDFGWSAFEGTHRFNDDQSSESHTPPIFEYDHGEDGCSVTGGHVYRGTQIPGLVGTYVFGDYCSGLIWGLQQATDGSVTRTELARFSTLVSFGEDAAGELYAVSLDGEVARLSPRE
jgi:glucose/arabinose dehydrogenase